MNRTIILSLLFIFFAVVVSADVAFKLDDIRTSASYGPFLVKKGERVKLKGVVYELIPVTSDRVSFKSTANGVEYGPIQVVNGRLGVIGNVTYRFSISSAPASRSSSSSEQFVPQPPAMPSKIAIPEQQPGRVVAPKYLPNLPEEGPVHIGRAWLALIDNTPVDWRIASLRGGDGAIERMSLGADIEWNYFTAALALSPKVECDDVASGDMGISGASLEEGTGVMLDVGYKRPFLVEGPWKASGGVRLQYRQDKGDINSDTSYYVDETDTNGVNTVKSMHKFSTSSVKIREISLWLDVDLKYVQEAWGIFAGVSIEPLSGYSVTGTIPCGGRDLSIDVERSTPIAFSFGGWLDYEEVRFFSDLMLGTDQRFRVGVGYNF